MSLKAKLEAVIYAAEEPVTLAQLAALFAEDALEWKARQAASALQAAEADLDSAADQPVPMTNAELAYLEQAEAEPVAESAEPDEEEAGTAAEPPAESGAEPDVELESTPGDEAEARRLARQRDREARAVIRQLLDKLIATCAADGRGVEIREIAGGYRMATKPEYHDAVRSFVKSLKPAMKLSLPALETLAVIAYKQPVTAPEVNEIRGVDSSGVFGSLLARKLIATAGRKPVIGRPILYKTTREFLLRFGLKDVAELPSMEEFEKMASIELDEPEMASEEDSNQPADTRPNLNPELEFDADADESPESDEVPAATAVSPNGTPAEPTPAEAAPAAPFPTEQAETEKSQNDR
jgi:segregation and condensation protein B